MDERDVIVGEPSVEARGPAPWLAKVDLVAGFAAVVCGIWLIGEARQAAAAAVRAYGRNVDSGAYLMLGAIVFVIPVGVLLLVASLFLWRRWPWARAVHYFALLWPITVSVVFAIATSN